MRFNSSLFILALVIISSVCAISFPASADLVANSTNNLYSVHITDGLGNKILPGETYQSYVYSTYIETSLNNVTTYDVFLSHIGESGFPLYFLHIPPLKLIDVIMLTIIMLMFLGFGIISMSRRYRLIGIICGLLFVTLGVICGSAGIYYQTGVNKFVLGTTTVVQNVYTSVNAIHPLANTLISVSIAGFGVLLILLTLFSFGRKKGG